jgi:hypothetical protein
MVNAFFNPHRALRFPFRLGNSVSHIVVADSRYLVKESQITRIRQILPNIGALRVNIHHIQRLPT